MKGRAVVTLVGVGLLWGGCLLMAVLSVRRFLTPPKPAAQLMLAERCTIVDVQLTSGQVEQLRQNGPLVVPLYLDQAKVDPALVCMDDAFVRVSIDGHEVIKVERKVGEVTDPAPPIHTGQTLTAGW